MENNNMGVQLPSDNKSSMSGMAKTIIGLLIFIAVITGGWLLSQNTNSTSTINSSDLVEETESGISFKRPMQWERVDSEDDSIDAAYTESGENLDSSDQGMLLSSEDLGVDYGDLTDEQKSLISDSFKEQFSDPASLQNGSCEEIGNVSTEEKGQLGYDTAFVVEATCEKFAGRNIKATIKMVIGIKDDSINIVGVLAVNETWEKSGDALDEILASVTPAS